MTLLGTDIYSGNPDAKVTAAINRADFVFHIFKATEGRTFQDPDYHRNIGWAEAAGDVSGAYDFIWGNHSGVEEAHAFLDFAQPKDGQLVAGDFENWDSKNNYAAMAGVSWETRWLHAMEWTQTILDETKTRPLHYVNWDYLKNYRRVSTIADWEWWIQNPLWLAQWQTGGVQTQPGQFDYAAPHKRPDGTIDGTVEWHPTFHQYISGSTSASGVDEDWFVGTRADLLTYTIQQEELFTVTQYEDIMGALALLSQRVESLEGKVGTDVVDALAGLGVAVEEVETNVLEKISDAAGGLGIGQANIISHMDQMAEPIATRVATAASSAVVETMDATLGGAEISARFVRQRGTPQ